MEKLKLTKEQKEAARLEGQRQFNVMAESLKMCYLELPTEKKIWGCVQVADLEEITGNAESSCLNAANAICDYLEIPKRGNRYAIYTALLAKNYFN